METYDYVSHLMTERPNKTQNIGRIDRYQSVTNGSLLLYNKGLSLDKKNHEESLLISDINLKKGSFKLG